MNASDDVTTLAEQLLRIPSPTGAEGPVMEWVAAWLRERGWSVQVQPVAGERVNVYATRGPPIVVLSTHLDTVPPQLPIRITNGVLHGRGACDAKGIAAAMMVAAEQLVRGGEDRVALLFVVGEEDGSEGALAAHQLEPKGQVLINGEPTGNRLATAQKGALKVTLEAKGKAAHSGYPELGDSAVHRLVDALARLGAAEWPSDPRLGATTLNVGRISGGDAPNVVAAWARAELLVRLIGPASEIKTMILHIVGEGIDVSFPLEVPVMQSPSIQGWEEVTVAYSSDLPLLVEWGTGYQLGPGTIHVAHTDHEQIAISDLEDGVACYVRLVRTLLAGIPR